MKIIKEPNKEWTQQFNCKVCSTVFEADVTDLQHKRYDGDFREPEYDSFWVCCPCCETQIGVSKEDIPSYVRFVLKSTNRKFINFHKT